MLVVNEVFFSIQGEGTRAGQPCVLDPGRLARWILDDGLPVRLQVQLHKYLWPGVERGV